jgi:hypothetical protein
MRGVKPWRLAAGVVAVVLVVAAVVAGRMVWVRYAYGEWSLSPSASPPRLMYDGREYRRADPVAEVDPGDILVDHVAGGQLYGPAHAVADPTVLELVTDDGVVRYSLVGGP